MPFTPGPVTLNVGDLTEATIIGYDQNGNEMDLPAGTTVEYTIDNPSVAAITPYGDGVSEHVQAVAAGTANLTATVQPPDGAAALSDTEAITVNAVTPPPPPASVLTTVKIAFGSSS